MVVSVDTCVSGCVSCVSLSGMLHPGAYIGARWLTAEVPHAGFQQIRAPLSGHGKMSIIHEPWPEYNTFIYIFLYHVNIIF